MTTQSTTTQATSEPTGAPFLATTGPTTLPAPDSKPAKKTGKPKRPKDSWTIFREAIDENLDAACEAQWTGRNRLVVKTENIRRFTLDLTKLPEDAPTVPPWNLQIDGQGIEISGRRGRILEVVQSPNGNWYVEKNPRKSKD